jgi:hypothetical protein
MKIEITKGENNPVTDFFSSPSNTPESDDQFKSFPAYFEIDLFCRKLERERDELRRMSVTEMMGENLNVKHHVTEWENRCLTAERERDEARDAIREAWLAMDETDGTDRMINWQNKYAYILEESK